MSFNRASSLATTSSLALSRRSSTIGSQSQLSKSCSVGPSGLQGLLVTLPTVTARRSGRAPHAINSSTARSRPFTTTSKYGECLESSFVKRDCAPLKTSQKAEKPLLASSEIPRYTNSFGEVGVIISRSGLWSTRGRKKGGFSTRLAFDKDLITALLDSCSDYLRVATIAQGGRYDLEKWPNAEDVEGLALGVEWVDKGAELQVLRWNGGERILIKKALAKTIVVNKIVADKVVANKVVAKKVVVKKRVAKRGVAKNEAVDMEALELWEDGAAVVVS
ncbi:MAG: hypothetical protein Q9195_001686 [Heterodermia aff. obscurata]